MTSGQRIKVLRKKAGMTQEELGAILGVSGSMIAQYETDKRNPKKETLARIADALDVHYLDLYSDDDLIEIASYVRVGLQIKSDIHETAKRLKEFDMWEEELDYLLENGYEFTEEERQAVVLFNTLNGFKQQAVLTDLARLVLNPNNRREGKVVIVEDDRPDAPPL